MVLRQLSSRFTSALLTFGKYKHSNLTVFVIMTQNKSISSLEVTKNIALLSKEKKDNEVINLKLEKPENKPLVVLLSWLMARKKHINKYANIYLDQGFDVLNISISPWQLLWPTKGSQMVGKDLLKFLDVNTCYSPFILHGLSVGAYLWSEVLVIVAAEREKYEPLVDRIAGQIWDSAADITEISLGLPLAVFPRNTVLQNTLQKYILYHLKTFDKVATAHYVRASQMFHTNPVRAPALILLSKTDPIGTETSNLRVKESWENMNMQVSWKCWDKSPHVGHFRVHQEEYMEVINTFLQSLNLGTAAEKKKLQAKL